VSVICSLISFSDLPCFDFYRSHDNAKFASSGGDRSVFLWDVATGVTTRRLAGHMGKIHVVEFNEDASVVASGISPFYLNLTSVFKSS
jgi:mitogen-activated protein kinase organizer 1